MNDRFALSRRRFLAGLGAVSATALAACGSTAESSSNGSGAAASVVKFDKLAASDGDFAYNAANDGVQYHHSDMLSPNYYVFAGKKDLDGAAEVVGKLGLAQSIEDYVGQVTVVNPSEGDAYTSTDADKFVELAAAAGPANNVKVIGIDDGADFVLGALAPKLYFVAGIMTFGGSKADAAGIPFVPAYLCGAPQAAVDAVIAANGAKEVGDGVYENPDDTLRRVVVASDADVTTAFANCWEKVFSKNYRQHNETTEFYMANIAEVTDPYLLYTIPDFSQFDYVENYSASVKGLDGAFTWFEYVPTRLKDASAGTVPLIVTLHGNQNDARVQAESSGWLELACEEDIIVFAPEWQDAVYESGSDEPQPNFYGCDGLQNDRLITWLDTMFEKYPQIDTHRVYVTGLSAGSSASELYGVKYADTFAAVGGVSGPGIDKEEIATLAADWGGANVPFTYICGDHDFFGMIPVDLSSPYAFPTGEGTTIAKTDPRVPMFSIIQSYQKINGLPVSDNYDLSLNPWYGVKFDKSSDIMLGCKSAQENVLNGASGTPIMKFVAVKDLAHWNWKPEAAYLWEFFKGFTR
ncbi:PHB depolymerase family esterase [Paratractidigestivibacter sp.]|uniref:PHB depolymerase family esterase n=1 Tax=Paratractidigestivibacter sp. TaxID=2847316 RepID=UPI002AC9764D|nr:PHB depolymerase family esterase [Paratractidigestivibacter sp.]